MTKQNIDDLDTLISHARRDMGYGGGGSYNTGKEDADGWIFDKKDAKKAERAITYIKSIILTRKI